MPSLSMPSGNLPTILFAENDVAEDQPIWVDAEAQGRTIDKATARSLVRRLAAGYRSAGLVRSKSQTPDVVVLLSENQPLHFPNILAIIAAGGIVATCPWQASVEELLYRVSILQPTAILCSRKSLEMAQLAQRKAKHPFKIVVQDSVAMEVLNLSSNQTLISDDALEWDREWNKDIANRTSVIVFSSGTTGYPKGLTNYLVPGSNIDLLVSTLERQEINFLLTVPPILQRLVTHDRWEELDMPSLQHAVVGAARCTPELQQAVTKKMSGGGFCQQVWGMTELTFVATMPVPGFLGPWESVGKLLDGNKIKVCAEDGTEVQTGMEGEIYISGPTKTNGYYGQMDEQRRASFVDEWLRSGDLGYVDVNGYLFITGRNKDLIKYNGAQVSPREIEDVIKTHREVLDAAVVGLELDDGNELPTAFVVLRECPVQDRFRHLEDIVSYTAKHVSPYKRLRGGAYAVEDIPKNTMGKVLYKDLRVLAREMSGRVLRAKI
ncbi:hypothetical protein F5X68DRAFT_248315 [Plectosphaerella plurivora]|uniref:Acetyl-CoA synthetase-like protein n=1 Tax=Plectosphaerella plurivora TaxID=936078 RepID=A0A9P9ABW2_9PEZI|nr:hypothetical protein F5X68DRAFT_248315 [Plectosphaerella plurivora]